MGQFTAWWRRWMLLTGAIAALSCGQHLGAEEEDPVPDGGLDTDGGVGASVSCAEGAEPGPAPLRRLSRVEYGNTVFQLFGNLKDQRLGVDQLVPDGETLGFSNQASVVSTSPLLASQYMDNATQIAEQQVDGVLAKLSGCSSAGVSCSVAVERWLQDFGNRVYRRPLTQPEVEEYLGLFKWEVEARGEVREGLRLVLELLLQSPHFLYRPEFGDGSSEEGVAGLTSWEMATRLSYFFWNTMPDVGLFEAAAADELKTSKQIEKQARRLLRAPRARAAFRNFHREWLDLNEVLDVRHNGKDLALFPDYVDAIPPELYEETLEFIEYAVFEGEGNLETLLTAPYTRMNRQTAAFYGVAAGPEGNAFETVELAPERHAGFLTQAGLLMAHSTTALSSPIHRGMFVRTNLLCQPPPPPPPDVPPPPSIDRTKTTREQYEEHARNATCAACHQLMDPIGLAFEHFDAMGRYREDEWGQPIDATGVIYQPDKNDGWRAEAEFDGAVELGRVLAASPRVKECVARQWFRFAMGRGEDHGDVCSLLSIDEQFEASGFDIQDLLMAIVSTPAFQKLRTDGDRGGAQ